MKTGLVLIDIQNDYFKGGNMELFEAEKAAAQAKKVLDLFRSNNWLIFYIKHVNMNKNGTFFIPETPGVDIYKDVYPKNQEPVIIKHAPDSFFQTELKKKLEEENVGNLVICGMMTHMCIDTTVRAARNFGYNVTLIEDACTTRDLIWNENKIPASTVQKTFMAALNGAFADIKTADEWIKEKTNR